MGKEDFLISGVSFCFILRDRLSAALEDVFVEKLKVHPHALVRLYPSLRRAAIEVQDAFEQKLAREIAASGITSEPHESRPQLLPASYSFSDIFGCASITVDTSALGYGPRKGAGNGVLHLNKVPPSSLALVHGQSTKESKIHEGKEADPGEKSGLIAGIHCCRDRYLQETAARMAAPILLMFPELDGFTSAVPSKRDLALLLTVIRTELITVLVEGDLSLLRVLSKEVVKVIRLLLVKIEGLLSHHNDVARINIIVNNSSSVSIGGSSSSSPLASGVCSRNAAQELNHQIAVLLFSFMDSLRALPVEALKGAQELQGRGAAAAALQTRSAAANEAFKADSLSEMKAGVEGAVKVLESLLTSSLLLTNVSTISRYVNELLGGILINETTSASATALCFLPAPSYCSSDTTALKLCSRPMRALVAAFPLIIGSHVMNLPADNALTTATAEECCLRLLASVISACSLLRPLSDATKKRLLADLELAELLVGGLQPQLRSAFNETPSKLPVIEELK